MCLVTGDQQFCPVDLLRNFMKEMQNGSLKPYNASEFLNTLECKSCTLK